MRDIIEELRGRLLPPAPLRRAIREGAGVTQRRLGAELKVTQGAISRYEAGRTPSPAIAERYAELLRRLQDEVA